MVHQEILSLLVALGGILVVPPPLRPIILAHPEEHKQKAATVVTIVPELAFLLARVASVLVAIVDLIPKD